MMMASLPHEPNLRGLRVLVVEDTFLVAQLIADQLEEAGCTIVGPAPRVERGLALAAEEPLDGALLDINLGGELCFPIAEILLQRGVPIAFLTGYGEATLPAAYRQMPRLAKPFQLTELIEVVRCHFVHGQH
jgi:DNA-binding response OmpR family regulator